MAWYRLFQIRFSITNFKKGHLYFIIRIRVMSGNYCMGLRIKILSSIKVRVSEHWLIWTIAGCLLDWREQTLSALIETRNNNNNNNNKKQKKCIQFTAKMPEHLTCVHKIIHNVLVYKYFCMLITATWLNDISIYKSVKKVNITTLFANRRRWD